MSVGPLDDALRFGVVGFELCVPTVSKTTSNFSAQGVGVEWYSTTETPVDEDRLPGLEFFLSINLGTSVPFGSKRVSLME